MPKAKTTKTAQVPRGDSELLVPDWMGFNHKTLVLKCDQYQLNPKGRKEALAHRLVAHFATQSDTNPAEGSQQTSTTNTANKENVVPNKPMEIVDASLLTEAIVRLQEQQSIQQQQTNSLMQLLQNKPNSLNVPPETSTVTPDPNVQGNNPLIFSPSSPSPNALQPHLTTYAPLTNNNNPVVPVSSPNAPITHHANASNPATTIDFNIATASSTNNLAPNLAPVLGFNAQHLLDNSNTTTNAASLTNMAMNPYIPPPITSALMAKIKKLDNVDFGEILACISPNMSNMGAYTGGEDGDEYSLSSVQTAGSQLTFKKRSARAPIPNISHWGHAWNAFYEATLHHHPTMHFQLFTYHKHIQFSINRKFSFLMAYDPTQRMQIAAQRHLPPAVQSASWVKHSMALFNTYLRDNMKPQCSKCLAYDHYAKQCTKNTVVNTISQQQQQQPFPQHASYSQQHWQAVASRPNLSASTVPQQPVMPQPPMMQPPNQQFRNAQQKPQHTVPKSPNLINITRNQVQNPCYRFNKGQACRLPCNYPHVCNVCNRPDHTGLNCNNTTTTSFQP